MNIEPAPSLLRLCLATTPLLAMTGEKTFYEFVKVRLMSCHVRPHFLLVSNEAA